MWYLVGGVLGDMMQVITIVGAQLTSKCLQLQLANLGQLDRNNDMSVE